MAEDPALGAVAPVSTGPDGRASFEASGMSWTATLRRVLFVVLTLAGCLFTALCLLLLVGCYRNDSAIEARTGQATAEVLSVSYARTIVRFTTPDGAVYTPPNGVLYSSGLEVGQRVRVEYDADKPDLVRVAGRAAELALLPVGTAIAGAWILLAPLLWLLRRSPRQA